MRFLYRWYYKLYSWFFSIPVDVTVEEIVCENNNTNERVVVGSVESGPTSQPKIVHTESDFKELYC